MQRMKNAHIDYEKKIKQLENENSWEKDQNIKCILKFNYQKLNFFRLTTKSWSSRGKN